jgi:hypothetical protein
MGTLRSVKRRGDFVPKRRMDSRRRRRRAKAGRPPRGTSALLEREKVGGSDFYAVIALEESALATAGIDSLTALFITDCFTSRFIVVFIDIRTNVSL